ncbi:zinc finger protein CONSTANS-LIKE 9 isoform X2 [Brassica rapa]|uniref:zinc finger protein CONSTANS-LIKE 9 isoform X2 n=1 Tax=Brassica campestris TaxID=3711 RepID=UPI0004F17F90|nr:zinc finger protein CONSTANS-LIKE 9 isoform X2 [Brassica rapa]XP_013686562.1 zinc finger protein CONSTANS-LIKE 9-like isoform X2 [Brassica napus]
MRFHVLQDLFFSIYSLLVDCLVLLVLSSHKRNAFAGPSNIPEYDTGEEGDLFKAPDSILEESILTVDPLSAALTMISCGEDSSQGLCDLPDLDLGLFQSGQQLLDKAFYECEQGLTMKSAMMESPLADVLDVKNISLVTTGIDESHDTQKTVSSGNLSSMDRSHAHQEAVVVQNFPDFSHLDFSSDYGMRRAFSEGDIQKLGTGHFQSPLDRIIVSCTSEDRREKLSRYRNKKSRRNFGRKIKYACRKALADNQPRIRGRFAKTEERK